MHHVYVLAQLRHSKKVRGWVRGLSVWSLHPPHQRDCEWLLLSMSLGATLAFAPRQLVLRVLRPTACKQAASCDRKWVDELDRITFFCSMKLFNQSLVMSQRGLAPDWYLYKVNVMSQQCYFSLSIEYSSTNLQFCPQTKAKDLQMAVNRRLNTLFSDDLEKINLQWCPVLTAQCSKGLSK